MVKPGTSLVRITQFLAERDPTNMRLFRDFFPRDFCTTTLSPGPPLTILYNSILAEISRLSPVTNANKYSTLGLRSFGHLILSGLAFLLLENIVTSFPESAK